MLLLKIIIFLGVVISYEKIHCSPQGEEVARWAHAIGKDLWVLGSEITRFNEIKMRYNFLNAQIKEKNSTELLNEIKDNILRMMDRKMDAIRCIQQQAESTSEFFEPNINVSGSYQYYSSKYSRIEDEDPPVRLPDSVKINKNMYLTMKLNNDTHFYNLPVNTTHSSVHVPTNVYDKEKQAAFAIQWSEALDEVFVRNYNSDPALSWQYFGSTAGIMRHYPAKRWHELKKDLFDCRIRTWFIEAATCTKDVVILFDNSGSMDGMGKHIASLTANSILDTFSNNDYVNIMNYSETTNYTVPCFENRLVQATKENIAEFKAAIETLNPAGKTQLAKALEAAFDLLNEYRKLRKCNEDKKLCNQAVMILTDGIQTNMSSIIDSWVQRHNDSNLPRIFTYLIGQEVTFDDNTKWLACANRGYYTHVQNLEQVTASVLKYITVLARPLVLHQEHPISWTHAYADLTYDDENDNTINEPYRLLTSAAIPVLNKNVKINGSINADLLGVAATDVPIDDFRKLTLPYKIGVMGYSFIVSNNGYLLMHPDLRPVFEGVLKENYNSIDLTEVEQYSNNSAPREITAILQQLRHSLVFGEEGTIFNVKLKYHYDDNRRVAEEYYDYYFAPLDGSPFSLAIAIPNRYGNYTLDVGDEIQKNRHLNQNLLDYFFGKWKVHPKWVYCRYHYLEGHEFKNPEQELLHFLKKIYELDFKWERQYEQEGDISKVECGRKTHDDNDYYCDKQLVQRVIFDAKNTEQSFKENFTSPKLLKFFQNYGANLRFVATMSGLTRWQYIFDEPVGKQFGHLNPRAIDEKWYKSAVLQHQYDSESFVYSVPFDAKDDDASDDVLVTGTYAIFPTEAGKETPGSVVGFQFSQRKFKLRVKEISTKLSNQCQNCSKCDEDFSCYIVDSSGYILVAVSNTVNMTGRFFGEIHGDVMHSMLERNIFKKITLYDYQALCKKSDDINPNSASVLLTPFKYVQMAVDWIFMKLIWTMFEINLQTISQPIITLAQELVELTEEGNSTEGLLFEEEEEDDDDDEVDEEEELKHQYYACEKEVDLFILDQNITLDFPEIIKDRECSGYYLAKISNSNLIFIAVDTVDRSLKVSNNVVYTTKARKLSQSPISYINKTLLPCLKLELNNLPRRSLSGCFNEHPDESNITECGKAHHYRFSTSILLTLLILNFLIAM